MTQKSAALCAFLLLAAAIPVCSAQTAQENQQAVALHLNRAQAALRAQRPDQAVPELAKVVELDPANVDAQANLGVLLYFRGHYAEAVPHLGAALKAKQ